MFGQHSGKALAAILSATMLVSSALPSVALAIESELSIEDHTTASVGAEEVSDLVIGGVDVPQAGEALDDMATVRSAEGESWDVPVLWIDSALQLVTTASEDGSYLPAIAFYVPSDYQVKATDGSFTVKLSDELVKLFGSNEAVAVYDASRGITYILPAHLRDYFSRRAESGLGAGQVATAEPSQPSAPDATPAEVTPPFDPAFDPENPGGETERSLVDIYCSKSARDSFSDEDLEWLLDLVINKLQPEAVNLLLDKFPAFGEGAAAGEIGKEIGLYVYCLTGDKDGIAEHENVPSGSLALVDGRSTLLEDGYHLGYVVGMDILSLAKKDDNGVAIKDPDTGKWVVVRDGEQIETLENTIVHEHFHALMFDYNRVGMTGSLNMSDFLTKPNGEFFSKEQQDNYFFTKLPAWFIEGTASAVENIFAFRTTDYLSLRMRDGELQDYYDMTTLVSNYTNAKDEDGTPFRHDLWYADGYDENGNKVSNEASAYSMGYLATLYLGELQARKGGKSAIIGEEGYTVSSEVLRGGINDILKRLHDGETLDEVISSISPVLDGKKAYNDTAEFQKKFIKGSFYTDGGPVEKGNYAVEGDYLDGMGSTPFVKDVLNYFLRVGSQKGRQNPLVNGSILFDFERDFNSPLDKTTNDRSDFLKIIESNSIVISTVPDTVALKDGGKSRSGTPGHDSAKPTKTDEYPIAYIEFGPAPQPSSNEASSEVQASAEETPTAPEQVVGIVDDGALPLAAKPAADARFADAFEGSDAEASGDAAVIEGETPASAGEADGVAEAAAPEATSDAPAPESTETASADPVAEGTVQE